MFAWLLFENSGDLTSNIVLQQTPDPALPDLVLPGYFENHPAGPGYLIEVTVFEP
jgi:hypothetical protein